MKNDPPSFFAPSLAHSSRLTSPLHPHRSALISSNNEDPPVSEEEGEGETEEDLDAEEADFPRRSVNEAQRSQQSSDDSSTSSDADDRRPGIHNDFLARQRSPFLAKTVEILSQSSLLNRSPAEQRRHANGNSHQHHGPRIMDLPPHTADLHLFEARQNLRDLKLDHRPSAGNGGSKCCITTAGPKNVPESGRLRPRDGLPHENAATGRSPARSTAHIISNTQKSNKVLVEMFPARSVVESYEENNRVNFQRHASMVYTRAPSREELARRVVDLKKTTKNSRRIQRKEETSICEEIHHVHTDSSLSPRKLSSDNALEIIKLQDQVAELQRILAMRESMLELCFSKNDDEQSDKVEALSLRVEELQQELAEKDLKWKSATETLQIKENEIQSMEDRLRDAEEKCALLTMANASNEEQLQVLRCEIAALLWQIEIDIEKNGQKDASKEDSCGFELPLNLMDGHYSQAEVIRKMYLAAVVVASRVASEECLTLLHLLRLQMQRILEYNLWQATKHNALALKSHCI